MNYKKIVIALLILSGLAGLVWLVWYFATHSKTLKVVSVDKATRVISTLSPLGKVNFQALNGDASDTTIKKTGKGELLYRNYMQGAVVTVVFTGDTAPQIATIDMITGKVTYAPPSVENYLNDHTNNK